MLPILSYFGYPVYNLPTCLVSNTLDYGKFNLLDTTDYIQGVFPVWRELGFSFDAIATGFIASERQAKIVSAYCQEEAAKGTTIYPNYTEACYLTGHPYNEKGVGSAEARMLVDKLRAIGARSVLITSITVDGQSMVVGYNHLKNEYFSLDYTEIPVHFPGTGDMFSAILIGHLLKGDGVAQLIDLNRDNEDKNRGIPVENFLHLL